MYDAIVVGGGPAGLAAAYKAWECGLKNVLICERDSELGGILNQCIHNGFGLQRFRTELTGPEYAQRFLDMLSDTQVQVQTNTMVLEIVPGQDGAAHKVCCINQMGYQVLETKSVVLAMGCRERTRGAISIPGERPAGIFTAGTAQRYLNIEGYMVGRRVVILGSGDIGLIMARRMSLEGAKVLACVEAMPYSGGLTRNIVQCLHDFDIPLYLSHTVTDIRGHLPLLIPQGLEGGGQHQPIGGVGDVGEAGVVLQVLGGLAVPGLVSLQVPAQVPGDGEEPGQGLALGHIQVGGGPDLQIDLLGHVPGVLRVPEDGEGQGVHRFFGLDVKGLQGGPVPLPHPGQQALIQRLIGAAALGQALHGHVKEHGRPSFLNGRRYREKGGM